MVLFNIDMATEKYDILKRNNMIDNFTSVLHLVIRNINYRIYFFFLIYNENTLLNFDG